MKTTPVQRLILLALTALLGLTLFHILGPFWEPLAWAGILAFLLRPVQRWLTGALGQRSGLAAGLISFTTPVVIMAPLCLVAFLFAHQMVVLVESFRLQDLRHDDDFVAMAAHWPVLGPAIRWLHATLPAATEHALLQSGAHTALGTATAASSRFVLAAGSRLVEFGLTLFLLFFMLRDGPGLFSRFVRLIPLEENRRHALITMLGNTTRGVVYGTGVTALAQGLMVGVGFAVCGLPAPIVVGSVAAVLALLPAGGAGLVWLPGAIALMVQGRPGWGIALLVWGLLISVIDNFLRPLLVASNAPVSTLMVFVGAVGGAAAFGMLGLILGPVVLSLTDTLLRFIETEAAPHPRPLRQAADTAALSDPI
ncbi:MAG: AI-2E family transporter [Verrucomicrobiales bacterium]